MGSVGLGFEYQLPVRLFLSQSLITKLEDVTDLTSLLRQKGTRRA
jgi:hypothetical protein